MKRGTGAAVRREKIGKHERAWRKMEKHNRAINGANAQQSRCSGGRRKTPGRESRDATPLSPPCTPRANPRWCRLQGGRARGALEGAPRTCRSAGMRVTRPTGSSAQTVLEGILHGNDEVFQAALASAHGNGNVGHPARRGRLRQTLGDGWEDVSGRCLVFVQCVADGASRR